LAPAQIDPARIALNRLSAATAAAFGVPGFFVPRVLLETTAVSQSRSSGPSN
jgi:hypothetical protein